MMVVTLTIPREGHGQQRSHRDRAWRGPSGCTHAFGRETTKSRAAAWVSLCSANVLGSEKEKPSCLVHRLVLDLSWKKHRLRLSIFHTEDHFYSED